MEVYQRPHTTVWILVLPEVLCCDHWLRIPLRFIAACTHHITMTIATASLIIITAIS